MATAETNKPSGSCHISFQSQLSHREAAEANYNTGYDIAKYQLRPMESLGLSPLRTVMEDDRASCDKSLHT